jgi:general secretion pathway protein F
MEEASGLFPPMASAMAEAGEANGRLDQALGRLAETLERSEAIRRTIGAALLYPAILTVIGIGVVLTMLLWVIPQFESLFSEAGGALPPMTRAVMGLSQWVRHDGLLALAVAALAALALARWLRRPSMRRRFDELVLRAPQLGALVRAAEVGRFARVLGSLVEGGVALPDAVAIARRSLTNAALAEAIDRVAVGLRQGQGLTASLAGEASFPREALSFVRTGEETARLGPMLLRLADVLDRDLKAGVERAIAILTPLITVAMGAIVATVIASVMTAILGFNDLALAP